MDALLAVAVEEVGLEGREGCTVEALWSLLSSRLPVGPITCLPPQLLDALWALLLQRTEDVQLLLPPLAGQAEAEDEGPPAGEAARKAKGSRGKRSADSDPLQRWTKLSSGDPRVKDRAAATAAGVRLVASEAVRMSVLGVYEIQDSRFPLSEVQLAALAAVGRARWRGTINADLANRLGIAYRNFYYIVKNLETRKLVVKNPVVFAPPGATVTVSSVLHLPRFQPAVKLGPGQMFKTVDAVRGMEVATYVLQDDNLHMRLVCSTIAETPERLVVESDLKLVCGFRAARGHRLWRRLRRKLEDQGYLSFETCRVRDRLVPCVRLLKDWRPPAAAEGEDAEGPPPGERGGRRRRGGRRGGCWRCRCGRCCRRCCCWRRRSCTPLHPRCGGLPGAAAAGGHHQRRAGRGAQPRAVRTVGGQLQGVRRKVSLQGGGGGRGGGREGGLLLRDTRGRWCHVLMLQLCRLCAGCMAFPLT
ncbi:hypothetical protein Agub_g4813 [Astrephomene gubernaculifera]|uniref:B-block binding subunit of TFIIIC domain-containing protein n=1 Tax=Astrephomene gubernaculifera TaxID=47775 RepID=A0AAD3DN93_9CHLO|nr:hypothetical protein Agub_g4813 [Astrephomene gubernaculifera]